ncbi:ribonuclease P protein component [Neptuniibacter caesariensis]|uniref:Ribonuclease P protein component n=1 Tax=Neptuniibacter caesariensis TaxID=207954 RepID=A0A7U8C6P3_NEPCE|nr:ribonuclease P protein component [Neptuniibacter caesariensis]EAR62568.1 ribonuclease P protein component [Oceanospirillum sp. MED92] [Neptuniibacter caesariensis]
MTEFRFPRRLRLLTGRDFQFVFDDAQLKVPDQPLLILARPNNLGQPRLGFVISKKNVRQAVKRNRVRRIIRESFRLNQHSLPSVDIIILARKGIGEMENEAIHKLMKKSWSRLKNKSKKLKQT